MPETNSHSGPRFYSTAIVQRGMLGKAGREGLPSGFAPHGCIVEPSIGTYFSLLGPAGGVRVGLKLAVL
jgi:hypothetical protein